MANIVIVGATSGIAQAVLGFYASERHRIILVARDIQKLKTLKAHLASTGNLETITTISSDFSRRGAEEALMNELNDATDTIDVALLAYGILPKQEECEGRVEALEANFRINFSSPALLANLLAKQMARQGHGSLAVITSVAGDRGRKSNFAYGASKAGLSVFVDGLRGRMYEHGVNIINVKPGLVETPMTAHLSQGPLFAEPRTVARDIVKAIRKNRDVIYTPWYWRFIMMVIRVIPETIFKRLNI